MFGAVGEQFLALPGGQPVDVEQPVEVIVLVLQAAGEQVDEYAANAVDLGGLAFVGVSTTGDGRRLAEKIAGRLGNRPAVIGVIAGPSAVVAATPAAVQRGLSAADLIKLLLAGRGGGNATFAQGKATGDPAQLLTRLRDLTAAA